VHIPDQPTTSRTKLASTVAARIVADIARLGWPEGEVVGSEPELLERYGVSRAVFREAVRLVEHRQVARMRRGPGGGLVVTAPSVGTIALAVAVYLVYAGAEIHDVFEARLVVEEAAAGLAPARLDAVHGAELRALVAGERAGRVPDHRELHGLVAAITGNPALELFVDLLHRVTMLYLPRGATLERAALAEGAAAHAAIADAILSGDEGLARRRMRRHLEAEADYLRARLPSRRRLAEMAEAAGRADKRAEATARRVFVDVALAGWPVGRLLGSEAELMARYDVSRAVLREAVRLLEHHQVARMRRGPGGGLFVDEPGVAAVTDAVALQVDRTGIEPRHLFEVRGAVEMAVLDRAMADPGDDGVARLRAAVAAERDMAAGDVAADRDVTAGDVALGHDVHSALAAVAGNPVLELLTLVLVRLTLLRVAAPVGAAAPGPDVAHELVDVHQGIVEAVVAGDRGQARRRMQRHLEALVAWLR
jgi:DNA-binding FadR family transcriptional regulator